jgi:hypothetical protein
VALKVGDQHYIVHQMLIGLSLNTRRSLMESALQNVMKIRQEEAEFFHADGRADMTELTSTFRNFAGAPKMASTWHREYSRRVINSKYIIKFIAANFYVINPR